MIKIGTITFHWATNYGAVMQAYALQKHLNDIGYETEIINYVPSRIKIIQFLLNIKNMDFSQLKKEYRLKKFRKIELKISKHKYKNNKSLFDCSNKYNAIICGSDQIWNESFTSTVEGKPTLSYFLNFAGSKTKKISYAASFGTDALSNKTKNIVLPELEKFESISVRENSGKIIIKDLGMDATLVLDPTMLLEKEGYNELLSDKKFQNSPKVFSYIIHNNQTKAIEISNYIKSNYGKDVNEKYCDINCGLYEWLNNIKNAKVVVTNSFHGMVFSIIFNTPFIIIPIENSGMNDRITTLLGLLNLENRKISEFNPKVIEDILLQEIDWITVEENLKRLRAESCNYLLNALKEN